MKVFFQIVGEQGHTFGYWVGNESVFPIGLWPYCSFIFFNVQQMVVPGNCYFFFIF